MLKQIRKVVAIAVVVVVISSSRHDYFYLFSANWQHMFSHDPLQYSISLNYKLCC